MDLEKTKINILDNGFVQYIDHMGDDLMVVNAARVSFAKNSEYESDSNLKQSDEKLISYLGKHKHWTPFAHPQITLHVKAPVFVRTQLFKHKIGLVENETSRRYVSDEPEYYTPTWRGSPTDGAKQGSSGFIKHNEILSDYYKNACDDAIDVYKYLLDEGVAPEQARSVLPQGMYTEWYWTGSLSAFARIYNQRSDPHSQWETQQYAKAISEIVGPLYPSSWKALCVN